MYRREAGDVPRPEAPPLCPCFAVTAGVNVGRETRPVARFDAACVVTTKLPSARRVEVSVLGAIDQEITAVPEARTSKPRAARGETSDYHRSARQLQVQHGQGYPTGSRSREFLLSIRFSSAVPDRLRVLRTEQGRRCVAGDFVSLCAHRGRVRGQPQALPADHGNLARVPGPAGALVDLYFRNPAAHAYRSGIRCGIFSVYRQHHLGFMSCAAGR